MIRREITERWSLVGNFHTNVYSFDYLYYLANVHYDKTFPSWDHFWWQVMRQTKVWWIKTTSQARPNSKQRSSYQSIGGMRKTTRTCAIEEAQRMAQSFPSLQTKSYKLQGLVCDNNDFFLYKFTVCIYIALNRHFIEEESFSGLAPKQLSVYECPPPVISGATINSAHIGTTLAGSEDRVLVVSSFISVQYHAW